MSGSDLFPDVSPIKSQGTHLSYRYDDDAEFLRIGERKSQSTVPLTSTPIKSSPIFGIRLLDPPSQGGYVCSSGSRTITWDDSHDNHDGSRTITWNEGDNNNHGDDDDESSLSSFHYSNPSLSSNELEHVRAQQALADNVARFKADESFRDYLVRHDPELVTSPLLETSHGSLGNSPLPNSQLPTQPYVDSSGASIVPGFSLSYEEINDSHSKK